MIDAMSSSVKRILSPSFSSKVKLFKMSNITEMTDQFEQQQMTESNSDQSPVTNTTVTIHQNEMTTFFKLIETDERIIRLLNTDVCCRIADKYLLAMVFVYFKRAKLSPMEYTRRNFFTALFLAHDMEEEDDDAKVELLRWSLGHRWSLMTCRFLRARDKLWKQINYRGIVSRKLCDEVSQTR
ncbi:hypothetical protein CHUAL_006250 [Chamberlinius hualienensis]